MTVFIAFEGGEGTGKSTQARLLATRLGPHCVLTHEPGATVIGAAIRGIVLGTGTVGLDPRAEALLMAADRAQHVAEVVGPALAAGHPVVSDRFTGSSLAYQGHGRRLGVPEVAALSAFATDGLRPDLVVLLTVPPGVRDERMRARGRAADRLEAEAAAFHAAVEAGFVALAAADPDRWVVLDGAAGVDDV
ncbi:MAG: dTMP kinase, partial [Acidimicrobiia bacterium]|nr:dTMP kinase [Acidimicrobiia bacterium]